MGSLRVPHILRRAFQAFGGRRLRTFPFIRQGRDRLGLLAPMNLRLNAFWRFFCRWFVFIRLNGTHGYTTWKQRFVRNAEEESWREPVGTGGVSRFSPSL